MRPARSSALLLAFAMAAGLAASTAHAACHAPCPAMPKREAAAISLLDAGIAAAGGHEALSNVAVLKWTGEATVHAGDRTIELGVQTRMSATVPPGVRSDSWLRDQGPGTRRTLDLGPHFGFMVRDDKRTQMPAPMLAHERLQYATYTVMLLAPLQSERVALERRPDVDGLRVLHAELPGAAPADLYFDAGGRVMRLENVVPDADDGKRRIAQRFDFSGTIESRGVRWPQAIRIAQDGKPFFELRLSTFEVEMLDEAESHDTAH
jgi:hypothetical protein